MEWHCKNLSKLKLSGYGLKPGQNQVDVLIPSVFSGAKGLEWEHSPLAICTTSLLPA